MQPAAMVISSGGEHAGMGHKAPEAMEMQSREISCHYTASHWRVRFLHSVETLHRVSKSAEFGL